MDSINEGYVAVADTVLHTLQSAGVNVQSTLTWSTVYHHGYTKNPFDELVEQTYIDTRSKCCDTHMCTYVYVSLCLYVSARRWLVHALVIFIWTQYAC